MVSIQHGWSEANVNLLTDCEARDPVSGYPGFRSVLCRVTKKGKISMGAKFNIGQKVKIIEAGKDQQEHMGKTGTITESFSITNFSPLPHTAPPAMSIGDYYMYRIRLDAGTETNLPEDNLATG